MPYTATERLFLTADGKVVKEGDPAAITLLVGEGGTLDDATAKQHGLKITDAVVEGEPDTKASAPKENKMVSRAPMNKGD